MPTTRQTRPHLLRLQQKLQSQKPRVALSPQTAKEHDPQSRWGLTTHLSCPPRSLSQLPQRVRLTSLQGISKLRRLRTLLCQNNELTRCWSVAGMALERADFGKNRMTDADRFFEVMASLGFLKKLNFADNCFVDEEALQERIQKLRPELKFFVSIESVRSSAHNSDFEGEDFDFLILTLARY